MRAIPDEGSPPALVDPTPEHAHVITRRAVASWVLYDLANTIFSMGVVSLYFPLWVRGVVGPEDADFRYTLITSVSMAIIFVASPLLGAMTDRTRRRMPFLVVSTLLCVGFTAVLAHGGFWISALFFVIANVAYQAGLQFYDAMLPEVSTPANRGIVGGIGVGVGYLGSFLAVGLGFLVGSDDKRLLFLLVAMGFLLFSLPCFLFVRERGNPRPRPVDWRMVRDSTRETLRTLRDSQQYPGLTRFLVGRVFYTDSINTVINIMAIFTANVAVAAGFTQAGGEKQARIILMFAISFAVVGGFVWGWITDRLGPRRTLNAVLRSWMAIFLAAAAVGILTLPLWVLYAVAAAAGFSLGGVWAADRPYMLRLTPPSRVGEFYGLYGMVGRFSAISGPLIWGIVTRLAIKQGGLAPPVGEGIAVIALLVLMITSYVILQPVSDIPGRPGEG